MVIANWYMIIRRPRFSAGEISAIYMGDMTDENPIPKPPIIRKRLNWNIVFGRALPIAEIAKSTAAISRALFRPRGSLSKPAKKGPTIQPSMALPVANPN
jgi:hypothetical protein